MVPRPLKVTVHWNDMRKIFNYVRTYGSNTKLLLQRIFLLPYSCCYYPKFTLYRPEKNPTVKKKEKPLYSRGKRGRGLISGRVRTKFHWP